MEVLTVKRVIACYAATVLLFLAAVIFPLFHSITGDEFGFCVICYYIVFPLAAFTAELVMWNARLSFRLIYVAAAALMGLFLPLTTFGSVWKEVGILAGGFAAVGLLLVQAVRHTYEIMKKSNNSN